MSQFICAIKVVVSRMKTFLAQVSIYADCCCAYSGELQLSWKIQVWQFIWISSI